MLENLFIVPIKKISRIPWLGSAEDYDNSLRNLGPLDQHIIIYNDQIDAEDYNIIYWSDIELSTEKCIVLHVQGQWIAKIFPPYWKWHWNAYEEIEITKPNYIWKKNPDLDKLMKFQNDPMESYQHLPWDKDYELIWYLDPKVNPLKEKVWALTCRPAGRKIKGQKDMGFVLPDLEVEFNEHLPDLGIDLDQCYPPFWELNNECAYYLDPAHLTTDETMYVIKFLPRWRKPSSWKWLGKIIPNMHVEYNPDLPDVNYELDYVIPWHDFAYEHIWLLDRKHLQEGEEDIWAFKIKISNNIKGLKIIDYVSPTHTVDINQNLPNFNYNIDYVIPWHDLSYKHIWYLDAKYSAEKVWAITMSCATTIKGEKEVGTIIPMISDKLDVIFISYNEPNADKNWQRVLEKAPWAKRIDGVEGIFNAHKAAAKLSKTDMFYVVDGDAYLVDDWSFDYQPGIFDRDCAYVWSSKNPINDLIYQNGGVKLFSKDVLIKKKKWTTLDMFTGIMPKIKSEQTISCITQFNVDEFSTWRSAFRECVKLYLTNQVSKLKDWTTKGRNRKFGKYAIDGAKEGEKFAKLHVDNYNELLKINNYTWLKAKFKEKYPNV